MDTTCIIWYNQRIFVKKGEVITEERIFKVFAVGRLSRSGSITDVRTTGVTRKGYPP